MPKTSSKTTAKRNRGRPSKKRRTLTVARDSVSRPSYSPVSEIEPPLSLSRTLLHNIGLVEAQNSPERNARKYDIDEYVQDPAQYLSTRRDVENAKSRLIIEINDAVTRLFRDSRTLPTDSPQWNAWFKKPLFVRLLSKIYGTADTVEELWDLHSQNYAQSLLNQEQLLRVILGAVISDWIFDKQHSEILKDPTKRTPTSTEDELARVAPALYQQILRRERHAFVKEKVGLEALARRLGREFYYETNDILSSSLTNFDDAAGGWRETLPTIFTTALELDGQLLIWGKMIKVIWPQFGEVADPVKMAIEGTPAGTQGLKVLATLFPAIIEVGMDPMSTSETHIQEALILRSLVLPQKFYGQLTIAESKRPEAP